MLLPQWLTSSLAHWLGFELFVCCREYSSCPSLEKPLYRTRVHALRGCVSAGRSWTELPASRPCANILLFSLASSLFLLRALLFCSIEDVPGWMLCARNSKFHKLHECEAAELRTVVRVAFLGCHTCGKLSSNFVYHVWWRCISSQVVNFPIVTEVVYRDQIVPAIKVEQVSACLYPRLIYQIMGSHCLLLLFRAKCLACVALP